MIILVSSKTCSQKFDCATPALFGTNCTYESQPDASTYFYQMQPCVNTSQFCNWGSADPTALPYVGCANVTAPPQNRYPGELCPGNTTCFGGAVCTAGTCVGLAVGAVCTTNSSCVVGTSCYEDPTTLALTCRAQAATGGVCGNDYDCVNTAGCSKGVCVDYFSVADGQTVTYLPGDLSFCQSGEADSVSGVCIRQTNVGTAPFLCSDAAPCVYKNADGTTTTNTKACTCSKGPNGNQYCPLGNGEQNYTTYVTAMKSYLQKTVTAKCHTLERLKCAQLDAADTTNAQSYYTTQTWGKSSHLLADAPPCVVKVLYPNLGGKGPIPPPPTNATSCPKVKCGSLTSPTCANFTIDATTSQKNFVGQTCNAANKCNVTESIFVQNTTSTATCVDNGSKTVVQSRFPGEKCDEINTCLFNQTCTGSLCTGAAVKENCTTHTDCKVGTFCKQNPIPPPPSVSAPATGVCTAILAAGGACTEDYECPNSQGCLNKVCTDWFSLALNAPTGNTTQNPNYLCKSRLSNNNTCYGVSYNSSMVQDKNGLVNCSMTAITPCGYVDSLGVAKSEDCQCSYDPNGGSYCRKGYNETSKDWINLAQSMKSKFSSTKCHTMNRFTCYDVSSSLFQDNYNYKISTIQAHNFYYASECIQKLFNSGEYIRYSFIILAALLINLI